MSAFTLSPFPVSLPLQRTSAAALARSRSGPMDASLPVSDGARFAECQERILVLTTVLSNYNASTSDAARDSRHSGHSTWHDVATLLTVGRPPRPGINKSRTSSFHSRLWSSLSSSVRGYDDFGVDNSTGGGTLHEVAVAGCIGQSGAECTIVVTQDDDCDEETILMKDLRPKEKDFSELASDRWDGNFDSHVEDVFSLMNALHERRVEPSAERQDLLLQFIHRRCFSKASMRLLNGTKIWKYHPIDIIDQWDSSALDGPRSFFVNGTVLPPLLASRNIHPGSDGRYTVNPFTARLWIDAFVESYQRMDNVLFPTKQKANSDSRDSSADDLSDATSTLDLFISCMVFFSEFLRCEPIKFILNQPRLCHLFEISESLRRQEYMLESNGEVIDGLDNEFIPRGAHESGGKHVQRYFATICAWSTAVFQLTGRPPPVATRARMVTLRAPRRQLAVDARNQVQRQLFQMLQDKDERRHAEDFIGDRVSAKQQRRKNVSALHAEAALVGLINHVSGDCRKDEATSPLLSKESCSSLARSFSCQETVIGTSKRCCWCCWRLQTLLQSKQGPKIRMPETHEIITPWRPPHIGVPLTVIQQLEKELMFMLKQLVIRRVECIRRLSDPTVDNVPDLSKAVNAYRISFPRHNSSPSQSSSFETRESYDPEALKAYSTETIVKTSVWRRLWNWILGWFR